MVLVLQRPERHGSLEGGELETCSEDAEGIYFGSDPFQWFPFTIRVTGLLPSIHKPLWDLALLPCDLCSRHLPIGWQALDPPASVPQPPQAICIFYLGCSSPESDLSSSFGSFNFQLTWQLLQGAFSNPA